MSPRRDLALVPREGFFVKDGRGWYTSDVGRSHAQRWPPPSTIRGALRAAWGQQQAGSGAGWTASDWEQHTQAVVLERLLMLRRPPGVEFQREHRMWPAPADAVLLEPEAVGGEVYVERLRPRGLEGPACTLGPEADEAVETLWPAPLPSRAKPLTMPPLWTEAEMMAWLTRGRLEGLPGCVEPGRRVDWHVTLDPQTQAARPSMLYSSEVVEGLERREREREWYEWAVGVRCSLPEEDKEFPQGPVGLGGRRRLAWAERLKSSVFEPPKELLGDWPGLRVVLATPASFPGGWLPEGFVHHEGEYRGRLPEMKDEVVLRAALVPRPLHLSTWDMARQRPRATRRLVPAGAVYFFHKRSGEAFRKKEIQALWLARWGQQQEEALGLMLPGRWDPEERT